MPDANTIILPGLKPVLELLRSCPERVEKIMAKTGLTGPRLQEIETICTRSHIPLTAASSRELAALCGNSHTSHQGVAAVLKKIQDPGLPAMLRQARNAPLPLLLALDQVRDPGNLGALARTAYALGAGGIILPLHNSVGPTPAALKSSAGALLSLPVCRVTNLAKALDSAEESDFTIYGAGAPAPAPLNAYAMSWNLPAILVLGSEESGLRPGVLKRCQNVINIPFARRFDSLNVAQAGGILLALCAAAMQQAKQS